MAQKNKEIELKLLIGREDLDRLLAADFMQALLLPESRKERRLVSTYYDTAGMSFRQQGVAYRVRDKGDGSWEATAKRTLKKAAGLSERLELNQDLTGGEPLLAGFAELGLGVDLEALAAADGGVRPLFTVDVLRTTYILAEKDLQIEMAVDKGEIKTPGGAADAVDEVELELLAGSEEGLLAVYNKICACVPVRAEERSKFARGLALLTGK